MSAEINWALHDLKSVDAINILLYVESAMYEILVYREVNLKPHEGPSVKDFLHLDIKKTQRIEYRH